LYSEHVSASEGALNGAALRIEYPGAFYHETARGNEQKEIYKSKADREQFFGYLESAFDRYGAVVHAYCLMSNHYHLLLETSESNLAQIMRHIGGTYTIYFNVKRNRSGHLFQGRYKVTLVDKDAYALELFRYIHLNPVRVGVVGKPEEYRWSSHRSFTGLSASRKWLVIEFVLQGLGGTDAGGAYRKFVSGFSSSKIESPFQEVVASTFLGDSAFGERIAQRYLAKRTAIWNIQAVRRLNRSSFERIIAGIVDEVGADRLT